MFRGETPKTLCVAKKPTHESPNDYCRCASCLHHFVDTRLWKTKHPRKRLQNFRQSWVLSKDRTKIHQSPSDLLYVMLVGCGWWISIRSVDNTQGWRKVWKRFRGCSRINENGGKTSIWKHETRLPIYPLRKLPEYPCFRPQQFGLLWYFSKGKQPTQSVALSFQSKQQQQRVEK